MGIVTGYLCVICLCILTVKAITRKCKLKKADKVLMKLHKPVSVIFIVLCLLHVIFVFPVLKNRDLMVNISGIAGVCAVILIVCLCYFMKNGRKKLKCHRLLAVLMAVCAVGHIIFYYVDFFRYKENVNSITIKNINLSDVKDGKYEGEYDAGYIYAKVEVEVIGGKIVSINLLEHRNERGKKAESIVSDIISKQKIDVDTVTSATYSSKVIEKAVENAIKK